MPSILFISSNDLVRGPLAVALLSSLARPEWLWQIGSAGMMVQAAPQPVHPLLYRIMRARGLDRYLQPARPVTVELLKDADLILCMEQTHLHWLGVGMPDFPDWPGMAAQAGATGRAYLFSEMFGARVQDDVTCRDNPTIEELKVAAENLEDLLKQSLPRMRELLGSARRLWFGNIASPNA